MLCQLTQADMQNGGKMAVDVVVAIIGNHLHLGSKWKTMIGDGKVSCSLYYAETKLHMQSSKHMWDTKDLFQG